MDLTVDNITALVKATELTGPEPVSAMSGFSPVDDRVWRKGFPFGTNNSFAVSNIIHQTSNPEAGGDGVPPRRVVKVMLKGPVQNCQFSTELMALAVFSRPEVRVPQRRALGIAQHST